MPASSSTMAVGLFALLLAFAAMDGATVEAHSPVRLSDVQTLTLRAGQMTTGRRSAGVPQVKCVGGTAGCNAYVPPVIQCTNKGSDGTDAQWECKADLDNAYRFGETNVACEGYSYPDDPFVLAGSCGVEYTLDLTQEGRESKARAGQRHTAGGYGHAAGGYTRDGGSRVRHTSNDDLDLGGILFWGIVLLCVVASCGSSSSSGHRSSGYGYGHGCHGYGTSYRGSGGSGFWTGAAVGAALGSSSRGRGYSSYGGGGSSYSGGSGSTGTRTASGFGGTRRR